MYRAVLAASKVCAYESLRVDSRVICWPREADKDQAGVVDARQTGRERLAIHGHDKPECEEPKRWMHEQVPRRYDVTDEEGVGV